MLEIRKIRPSDYACLGQLLYLALHNPTHPLPPSIIHEPALARYVASFGRAGDAGVVLAAQGRVVGAIWTRLWTGRERGYGFVDAGTPELAMALEPAYRGQGYGQQLLTHLLDNLRDQGYHQLSLSVQKDNRALHLYRRLGFRVVSEGEMAYTMLRQLT